jgi:hypothetical protein
MTKLVEILTFFVGFIWISQQEILVEKFKDFGSEMLMKATAGVITEYSPKLHSSFHLFFPEHLSNDFAMKLLDKISADYGIKYSVSNTTSTTSGTPIKCSVLVVDSFQSIYEHFQGISHQNFKFNGYFLIVLLRGRSFELSRAFELFWKLQIFNVNFLYQNASLVEVETFMPFTFKKCGNTESKVINSYENETWKNGIENFFPSKLKDLNNCSLTIGINQNRPYVIMQYITNKTYNLVGREVKIVEELSRSLNFHVKFKLNVGGILYENGTATGSIGDLLNKSVDFIIADYSLKLLRLKFMEASSSYYSSQIGFVFSPRPKFSQLENLYRPLDSYVWLSVLTTFSVGVIVILSVRFYFVKAQQLILGENINTPLLNMMIAVFGGSQTKEPKNNFARVILMLFIMFCLILRTLYQSSLFRFLQLLEQKDFQTIDELIDNKYKIFTSAANYDLFPKDSHIFKSINLVDYVEIEEVITKLHETTSKSALLRSIQGILFLNQENNKLKKTHQTFRILKEFYATLPSVIYFNKNFYLVEMIDDEIGKYQASGLIEHWHSLYVNRIYSVIFSSSSPKILNMKHLGGGFQLCLFGWLLSLLIFIVELICKRKSGGR